VHLSTHGLYGLCCFLVGESGPPLSVFGVKVGAAPSVHNTPGTKRRPQWVGILGILRYSVTWFDIR
jgi:hypothetical protein